jgi:CelD/BcsL family acetyltransferase involved in cellulose biosynthesis
MVSTLRSAHGDAAAEGRRASLASAYVIESLSEAEPYWRLLHTDDAIATPYQNFEFLAAWQREVGVRRGVTPFIVVGFDQRERPLCLLPFGLHRVGPIRQISFLGGKHANFNFGIWDRALAASVTANDLQLLLQTIAASPQRPDLLTLYSQPRAWLGVDNPFVLLPHRQAANNGAYLIIDGPNPDVIEREVGSAMRGRLRAKERKLKRLSGYRYFQATESGEVARLLDRFFALKVAHMAAQGLPNVFAEDGVEAFLRAACQQGLDKGRPAIELHGLEGDGEVLALFGALAHGPCLSVMINTYTQSENARNSPGLVLILQMIQVCADRGIAHFDLGVGDAQYKSWFCKRPMPLFDSFLPLTSFGRLPALGLDTASALKREIKNTPALWNAYRSLRKTFAGSTGENRD